MIKRTHHGIRWLLADDFAPRLEAVLAAAPFIVKESGVKLVARHEVDGQGFYVKRYRHYAVPLRPLKFLVKPSQAAQEWRLAGEFERRGVPAVRHVALGERWTVGGLQESILITEEFEGAVPFDHLHRAHFPRVVEFVTRIGHAGILHHDLHPSNLLFHEGAVEIRLVDLHGAEIFGNGRATQATESMLAQLCVTLPLPVSDSIREQAKTLRRRLLFARSKRCLKKNRDFDIRRFGSFRWHVRRADLTAGIESKLRQPDTFLTLGRVLKAGRGATVGAAGGLVLKRYNFKKPLNLLKDLFRGSPAERNFRKGYHLELCGLPTSRVIAAGNRQVWGVATRSYVFMAEVKDAVDAGRWPGETARSLGLLVARLHDEGFVHRDLKQTNILFDVHGAPFLIDLDGLAFVGSVKNSEAAANLRRLALGMEGVGKLTRANVVRFLRVYCRQRGIFPHHLFPRERARR